MTLFILAFFISRKDSDQEEGLSVSTFLLIILISALEPVDETSSNGDGKNGDNDDGSAATTTTAILFIHSSCGVLEPSLGILCLYFKISNLCLVISSVLHVNHNESCELQLFSCVGINSILRKCLFI